MSQTTWIRVRDTRTDSILPNPVPATFVDRFDYLAEVPSSRNARDITEPAQPGQNTPDEVPITEPETPTANGRTQPINGKKVRNA